MIAVIFEVWPRPEQLPPIAWPLMSAALLAASSGFILLISRVLPGGFRNSAAFVLLTALAVVALVGGLGMEILAHWRAGLRPDADAHAAMVYMASFLQLELVLALVVIAAFAIARRLAGLLNRRRRVVYDNLSLIWHYTVAQGLLGLLLVHGFPRLL